MSQSLSPTHSLSYYHKKLLFFSVFLSLAMHLAEMHFLQRQTLWFSSAPKLETSPVDWTEALEKMEKDQILKDAFINTEKGAVSTPNFTGTQASLIAEEPLFTETSLPHNSLEKPTYSSSLEAPNFSDTLSIKFEPPVIRFEEQISLLTNLPRELILPPQENVPAQICAHPIDFTIQVQETLPHARISAPSSTIPESQPVFAPSWVNQKLLFSSIPTPTFPAIQNLPTLSELRAASYSDAFESELVFYEVDDGFLFALTLIPQPDLPLAPLKQNYLFLIDRSNSIQKERLNATKSAVRRAIDELNKNDQFNILVFDQKIEKLSPTMLPMTAESISKAHQFINKIELGSFFSQKNLNKPLFLTLPHSSKNDELYTAILITDGENLSQQSAIQGLVSEWSRMNQGKVSLYTLGMSDDAHVDILDAISNMNRGKNFSSPTYRGLKRKLLKIMKTVHAPVAKNITCKAIPRYGNASIELFPKPNHAPHLYAGEPYVILGATKTLDDFVLFVQASLDDQWLHIKKNISFNKAKKGSASLATELAQLKSFDYYQQYLEGKGLQCLNEAQTLIKQYELPSIFENF
ncbi:MAG TPA: VWA domain-containing protein [Chlamydiales bacterium]|nr:VWA domain-containing protein [Chlamydiales bacterium]